MEPLFHAQRKAGAHNPVGASLLAIAVCQPKKMLNVWAPSRASSLPQGLRVFFMTVLFQTIL
nr:hypothetical protein C1892_09370 [Pseudomonas sp. MPBD7-1]